MGKGRSDELTRWGEWVKRGAEREIPRWGEGGITRKQNGGRVIGKMAQKKT